jgi:SAM-dependent methyltransferase
MSQRNHWESVYTSKPDTDVSWTQTIPEPSLSLIRDVCPTGSVVDVGGGNSRLAGQLIDLGYRVTVLDIAKAALERARNLLGERASQVRWIQSDITQQTPFGTFDVWHDRAVFHFLTSQADRRAYLSLLTETVLPNGHAIIATFALDGPTRCSGLAVNRYDGESLANELGEAFRRLQTVPVTHETPWGTTQSFQYSVFRRVART